jgi:acetyl esterase/lipase
MPPGAAPPPPRTAADGGGTTRRAHPAAEGGKTPAASALPRCPPGPGRATGFTDRAYARASPAQKLDVYVPSGRGPYPAVLWIHGGAWSSGDKNELPIRYQAERGYVVASMQYRLSAEAKFPAQLHDAKAALRYLRAHAGEYEIDPARIAVAGDSAGGHLAALLALTAGDPALEGAALGKTGVSSAVAAAAIFYGPSDLASMNAQAAAAGCKGSLDHDAPDSPESLLLGCTITEARCRPQVQAASPVHYVDAGDPPMLLEHGALDCVVPAQQSRDLHKALSAAGVDSQLVLIPGQDHGGAPFHRAVLDGFLDSRLRRCR